MDNSFKLIAIGLAASVYAIPQASSTPSGSLPATTAPSSTEEYSTVAFNSSAASTYLPNDDYSNERLAFLWDQVGPIETAAVTTVVEPTPEPSPFPQPNWVHPLVPPYNREIEDAQLPPDFLWGVASACTSNLWCRENRDADTVLQRFRSKARPMLTARDRLCGISFHIAG